MSDPTETCRCKNCGHICRFDEMLSDAHTGTDPEAYSDYICPNCGRWYDDLADGWVKVNDSNPA